MLWLLAPLGLLAGALTTVAGLGGGMMLVLVISLIWDPHLALAVTAPALLVGNLHRAWMFRAAIDRKVARAFIAGALPGALAGGFFAVAVPDLVLNGLMLVMALLAVSRSYGAFSWQPSAAQIVPAAGGIGFLNGTAGGAGVLVSPLLMATGLTGRAYIATGAVGAAAMHVGRVIAYGAGGLVGTETLVASGLLAVALLGGNLVGKKLREHLTDRASTRIEIGVLLACSGLAIAGLAG
jgi:uncharacterized membrane protein YfcA